MRLQSQFVIATGAASGAGRAIAQLFAAAGARVVIAGVTQDVLEGALLPLELIATDASVDVLMDPTVVAPFSAPPPHRAGTSPCG